MSRPRGDPQGRSRDQPRRWLDRWRHGHGQDQDHPVIAAQLPVPPPASDPGPQQEVHRSPGLCEIFRHLHRERPLAVLDLGPAMSASVEFFSQYRCRLHIVDLLTSLAGRNDHQTALPELLPSGACRFDLLLIWDTLDHLERTQAQALVRHLARLARPGAWLLAHVATSQENPRPPTAYAVLDSETLLYRPLAVSGESRLIFSPAAIESLLDGFRIEHSYILRHQVHEWIAVRES